MDVTAGRGACNNTLSFEMRDLKPMEGKKTESPKVQGNNKKYVLVHTHARHTPHTESNVIKISSIKFFFLMYLMCMDALPACMHV